MLSVDTVPNGGDLMQHNDLAIRAENVTPDRVTVFARVKVRARGNHGLPCLVSIRFRRDGFYALETDPPERQNHTIARANRAFLATSLMSKDDFGAMARFALHAMNEARKQHRTRKQEFEERQLQLL